jgi:two-component system, chemotaxis family, chemotaxis protein CheV
LIDLSYHLQLGEQATSIDEDNGSNQGRGKVVVIIEFNQQTNAFLADAIFKIHRVNWSDFKPLNPMLAQTTNMVTGSINIDGKEIMILDMEHIIGEIFPETLVKYQVEDEKVAGEDRPELREEVKLFMAEDSTVIRTHLLKLLKSAGYKQVQAFENGATAWRAISQLIEETKISGRPVTDSMDILISDIEMPEMDGLTLCKNVKTDPVTEGVPVVMFSSLITDQMAVKCRSVGADECCTKPQTAELVEYVDKLALGRSQSS